MPEYSFNLNGEDVTVEVPGDVGLLYVLRDLLGVRGPKYGCGVGVCRACTCHVETGGPEGEFKKFDEIQTCVTMVSTVDGKHIRSIEGLAEEDGTLHPLQQAWIDNDVAQCGFCQPGQIMTACAKLAAPENTSKSTDEICDGIENVCRCGSYHAIREAIKTVRP